MGSYINPAKESKESFLHREGVPVDENFTWKELPADCLPVCLVANAMFTAAGICYCEQEFNVFKMPDPRPRRWYLVEIKSLLEVSDLGTYRPDLKK